MHLSHHSGPCSADQMSDVCSLTSGHLPAARPEPLGGHGVKVRPGAVVQRALAGSAPVEETQPGQLMSP